MLYERDTDPASLYQAKLKNIARSMLSERCMFFLGAGASIGPPPSLPTAKELSVEMARQCQLEWHEYIPLSTIAFYYESYFTRKDLNQFLKDRIGNRGILVPPTIKGLMKILRILEKRDQVTYTITTNYDQQFETAYETEFHSKPDVIIYKGAHDPNDRNARLNVTPNGPLQQPAQFWRPNRRAHKTILYKMHGCISQPQERGLVITEEDYINFLANALGELDPEKTLLNYIKGELSANMVLFIGYSLSDWNFRAIFKGTVEKYDDREYRSYAVQWTDPAIPLSNLERAKWESLKTFWHEKEVDILNAKGQDFVGDLLLALDAEQQQTPAGRAEAQHAGA